MNAPDSLRPARLTVAIGPILPENPLADGFPQTDCDYEPRARVPVSGVYETCHKDEPREWVLLLQQDVFKACDRCGVDVRYKLVRASPHISEDPDFEDAVM